MTRYASFDRRRFLAGTTAVGAAALGGLVLPGGHSLAATPGDRLARP
jgi:hypothetical protein